MGALDLNQGFNFGAFLFRDFWFGFRAFRFGLGFVDQLCPTAGLSGLGGTPGIFGQSNYGQSSVALNTTVVQQAPVLNPFGTLPAMPLMSIGRAGTSPSIQYGISSLPLPARSVVMDCLAAKKDVDSSGEIVLLPKLCPIIASGTTR